MLFTYLYSSAFCIIHIPDTKAFQLPLVSAFFFLLFFFLSGFWTYLRCWKIHWKDQMHQTSHACKKDRLMASNTPVLHNVVLSKNVSLWLLCLIHLPPWVYFIGTLPLPTAPQSSVWFSQDSELSCKWQSTGRTLTKLWSMIMFSHQSWNQQSSWFILPLTNTHWCHPAVPTHSQQSHPGNSTCIDLVGRHTGCTGWRYEEESRKFKRIRHS